MMQKFSNLLQAQKKSVVTTTSPSKGLTDVGKIKKDESPVENVYKEVARITNPVPSLPRVASHFSRYSAITLTFGDCAENHVGMQIIGKLADKGFTLDNLLEVSRRFPPENVELIRLHDTLASSGRGRKEVADGGKKAGRERSRSRDEEDGDESGEEDETIPEAYVLILRNALPNHQELMEEMMKLDWDKKALMRGRVVNKSARYNLCFDDSSSEPNYEEGRGRIVSYDQCPILTAVKHDVVESVFPESSDLKVEGNLYYDVRQCGIGYHGDSERRKVIGVRIGASFPLVYRWYRQSERVGDPVQIDLQPGDMYMMSEKATGCDWKKRKIYTLRHAAGCSKYIK